MALNTLSGHILPPITLGKQINFAVYAPYARAESRFLYADYLCAFEPNKLIAVALQQTKHGAFTLVLPVNFGSQTEKRHTYLISEIDSSMFVSLCVNRLGPNGEQRWSNLLKLIFLHEINFIFITREWKNC